MQIYFVNKKSNVDGPYGIEDSHRRKIIQIGDVILRETTNGISFLLVVSEINKWNACQCIGYADDSIDLEGNTLVFSFDGVNQRRGNLKIIEKMMEVFKTSPIIDFFINAYSILTYKSDLWDISVFYNFRTLSPNFEVDKSEDNYDTPSDNVSNVYLFEKYMSDEILHLFNSYIEHGKQLRDIYTEIRQRYPSQFRQSLKHFLREHPTSTIYDRM